MELLIIEDMYEIPISLLIRNDRFSSNYKNFIRACYVHTKVWSLLLGEYLFGKNEPSNRVYKNSVTVIRLHSCGREESCGRSCATKPFESGSIVSLSLSLSLPHFYLELEVTRKRVNREGGYRLEILARFCLYGTENATQWLEARLTKIEEQLKESVNYYLK